MKLNKKKTFVLYPKPPFNFDATVFKPSHYPDPLKVYEPGKYWFALRFGSRIYGVKLLNKGTIGSPKVQVVIFSGKPLNKEEAKRIVAEVGYRFEFERDVSEFNKKFKNDKILRPFLKKWRGMRMVCAQDLYGLLMILIFLQNTMVRRTVQMTKAMLSKYGVRVNFDKKQVFCFWRPERMLKVPEKDLRALKVGYRAKLFIKTSETFVKEKINEFALRRLPKEEIKKELLKIYGVGPETARGLLHECFHSWSDLEHVAPWQQKIYSRLLFNKKLVPAGKIIKYAHEKWGKWATLATHYIWEDIFWRRKHEKIPWLEKEVRL